MPKIKLCLDIEISNYSELAKLYASRHNMPEALVAMMPETALKTAVDGKIVEKVKLKLGDFVGVASEPALVTAAVGLGFLLRLILLA